MAKRKFNSEAEYYRHHRMCFELSLELGCTPREADNWLKETERRERHRARMEKRGITSKLPPVPKPSRRKFERWEAPHMMRD